MTVLVVPSWYRADPNAQLGSFFREQAMALQKGGCQVVVADATLQSRNNLFSKNNYKLRHFSDQGLDTYTYTVPALGLWRMPALCCEVFYRNLKKIYKAIVKDGVTVDVIHAHSFYPAGCGAARLGKELGIPVVVTEHASTVISGNLSKEKLHLLQSCVQDAAGFICVSNALKAAVVGLTNTEKTITVIPNMVDKRFAASVQEDHPGFTFVSVGNLVQSKRFDLTLRAFAECFRGNAQVRLKIIGDGVKRQPLEQLSRELGVESQVIFTGRIPRDQVPVELQKAQVFVLPSDFETFGVVYIEAMACGLPVIGTKNGGADDIITPENGFLVDTDNVQQLREAMLSVYSQYANFDKAKIAAQCRARFGEETVTQQIIGIYQALL